MVWRKWDEASAKDQSEVIRNLVSTAAVLIAGGWALYQWDTFFPKTTADVLSAAAAVRTDVQGELRMQLGDGGASSLETDIPDCSADPAATWTIDLLVSGNAKLTSASAIPVSARFEGIEVSSAPNYVLRLAGAKRPPVRTFDFTPIGTAGPEVVMGGLVQNRVEKGQSVQSSFLFSLDLPFSCGDGEKLVSFRATFDLAPIDPRNGTENPGASVKKVLISTCQVQSSSTVACNVDSIEAYGQ